MSGERGDGGSACCSINCMRNETSGKVWNKTRGANKNSESRNTRQEVVKVHKYTNMQ